MPIRHLDAYLAEKKHNQTLPLQLLSETRIGIDASYYLQLILDSPSTREPLLAATGGLPLALASHIESDLRILDKLKVKPVFVFPGLPPKRSLSSTTPTAAPNQNGNTGTGNVKGGASVGASAAMLQEWKEACVDRKEAWAKYEAGQEDAATRLFEGRAGVVQWDLWRIVLRLFRHRNVEFIVAPYLAWAQLIYLLRHQKSYIHSIYGPTDTLLYPGVDKLITNIDFKSASPTFTFASKRSLLSDLAVSEDQFLDIGILLGFDPYPPFPPYSHDQGLRAATDMVKYYKSGHASVQAYAEHPAVKSINYFEHFARVKSMIRFSLILSTEGQVVPLPLALPQQHMTANDIPNDLHELFSHRLPDEVYFYLSRGLIGPQALVWLTSGQIIEPPPLDNGETTEYQRFIKEVITDGQTGPRATSLALLTSVLSQTWGKKNVVPVFWFSPNGMKSLVFNSNQTQQLVDRVKGWLVPCAVIEDELRRQNSSTIDFMLCLGATSAPPLAARTKTKSQASPPLEKKDEIVANVIWRFLELRGFLLATHQQTPLGKAMSRALAKARVNDKFQDGVYLFLELVRAGVMHGHLWSGRAFSGGPSFGTDGEKKSMLLIMRVLSIVPIAFRGLEGGGWGTAPLSRELLVFNSFLRALTRSLRTLVESIVLSLFLAKEAKRARDDFLEMAISLPFQTGEGNTGLGVLCKVYLDALWHFTGGKRTSDGLDGGAKEKEMALEVCDEAFGGGVRNARGEVERGFRFWDCVVEAMRALHEQGQVLAELIEQFEDADKWLRPMRPDLSH